MTTQEYEELYCAYCDSQRCGDEPPYSCPYWDLRVNKDEWVECRECIYVDDDCVESRRSDGCYFGEKLEGK